MFFKFKMSAAFIIFFAGSIFPAALPAYSDAENENRYVNEIQLIQSETPEVPDENEWDVSEHSEQEAKAHEHVEHHFQPEPHQEHVEMERENRLNHTDEIPRERMRERIILPHPDSRQRIPPLNQNRQRNYLQELAEQVNHRMEAVDELHNRVMGLESQMRNYFQELSSRLNHAVENQTVNDHHAHQIQNQRQEEMRRHEQELQQQREQMNQLRHELEEEKKQHAIHSHELQNRENQLQQQYQNVEREQGELNRQREEIQRREEELQRRIQEVENRFRELEDRERKVQQLQQELDHARNEIQHNREQLEREREDLRRQNETREQQNNQDNNERKLSPVGGIILVLFIILWLWALQDCLRRGSDDFPSGEPNDKLIWTIVLLITLFIGAIVYVFLVQGHRKKANKSN